MHTLRDIYYDENFRRYFKSRMGESLITGVPEIVNAKNCFRRSVKSIVFVSCTVGFIYQTYSFLQIYLEYQTIQDFKVEYPEKIYSPAVTFCNRNRINREKFCRAFPEKCTWYDTPANFCTIAPVFCPDNWEDMEVEDFVLGIPDTEYNKNQNQSKEFLNVYGPQSPWDFFMKPFYFHCKLNRIAGTKNCNERDIILFQAANDGLPYKCFTIYSLFEKPDQVPNRLSLTDTLSFSLNTHPEQLMDYKDIVQFHMFVHDPRRIANPLAEGTALRGGNSYLFYMTMQERKSLPPPYNTYCKNYIKEWEKNGGKGPVTKKDCTELCKIRTMMQLYGCVGRSITYPNDFPICPRKNITLSSEMNQDCSSSCREACDITVYTVLAKSTEYIGDMHCSENSTDHCKKKDINVTINFERLTVQKFKTDPKFESIELFSYIGGYMGMWLGISLVSMFDFLEVMSDIIAFAIRIWKRKKEMSKNHLQLRQKPQIHRQFHQKY